MPIASSSDLAAEIGPYLVKLLHSREAAITAAVHPAPMRWATRHILPAVETELPLLANHVIGYIASKLKDVTFGEGEKFLETLIATSDFSPPHTP